MITTAAHPETQTHSEPTAWEHQASALDFIRDKPGSMLAMAMGTGKSRVAIDLIRERDYRRVLILAPKSVVDYVWPGQIALHAAGELAAIPLTQGSVAAKREVVEAALRIRRDHPAAVIVNYEAAWREPLASWLRDLRWDLLVMDECHKIKAPGGVASRFCSRLADRIPQRLGLTGTPMPHSPLDIYAQYRALNKRVFGTSFNRFKHTYAIFGGFEGRQVVAFKSRDELRAKFRSIAFQVRVEDALDLPPVQDVTHHLDIGPKAQRVYRDLSRHFLAELAEGYITAANALSRLLRLQQVTSGYGVTEEGAAVQLDDAKAKHLTDLLEGIDADEPVVVFARFRNDLDQIASVAAKLDRPAFEVSGRIKQLDEWRDKGGVLAVQIQAGGLGLDLSIARYCIYFSLGFSLGDYQQSRARLHRPGQTRPVEYIHLIARDTVDLTVMQALERKENAIDRILRTKTL